MLSRTLSNRAGARSVVSIHETACWSVEDEHKCLRPTLCSEPERPTRHRTITGVMQQPRQGRGQRIRGLLTRQIPAPADAPAARPPLTKRRLLTQGMCPCRRSDPQTCDDLLLHDHRSLLRVAIAQCNIEGVLRAALYWTEWSVRGGRWALASHPA